MWKTLATTIFAGALFPAALHAAETPPPRVVASIQPLHSIAAMIMDGIAKPDLIVSGSASEHGYALKPSDMRKLKDAQVVILIDEHYETFLAKPIDSLGKQAVVLALADLPGATVLKPREGGIWDEHAHHQDAHEKGADDADHHGHDHGGIDGHLWLDPANAILLAVALAEQLGELDPAHAAAYHANEAKAIAKLEALDRDLAARTQSIGRIPYVVFHDAYQYFEARYGLHPAGSITIDPERPPSAKRLAALRDKLIVGKSVCVFREPQFPAPVVDRLAQESGSKAAVLDPQGAALPPGPDLYVQMMSGLAESLTKCLNRP
jgi:zinc transport system substrate-binding protein